MAACVTALVAFGAVYLAEWFSAPPESIPATEAPRALAEVAAPPPAAVPIAVPQELSRGEAPELPAAAEAPAVERSTEAPPPSRSEHHQRAADPQTATHSRIESPVASLPNSLTIESEPRGATVRVNGKTRGQAPIELAGLAAGSYDVVVEFPGVPPQTRTVNLAGGAMHTITFRLSR